MKVIDSFSGKYAFLSNFYAAEVEYEGISFLNSEAAFQAAKVLNFNERLAFSKLQPNEAKRKGRRVALREDWEAVKDDVMYQIVKDKFTRSKQLKELLLDTGDAELVEGNYWNDTYWGQCNGVGQNKLGKILMRVRQELR